MTETATLPAARFARGTRLTILIDGTADDEYPACAPGDKTYLMLGTRLDDGRLVTVPLDYPGIDVIEGDMKQVLIAMARDALVARTLMNGCRVCETGHPCPECVIDVQRQREYRKVLEALGAE